jgi:hypothetical protein
VEKGGRLPGLPAVRAGPSRSEIGDAAAWSSAELLLDNLAAAPVDLVLAGWQAVVYRRQVCSTGAGRPVGAGRVSW